jgi:protein-S-isoprenylcysteine O-methyltransferase Ste14
MPLREELRHTGNWLFRWRSYLPLVVLVAVLVAMTTSYSYPNGNPHAATLYEALCFVVSLLGLAVRIAAVGCAPQGTSGRNTAEGQVATTVNTTGLYSLVRHPLYLGNFLMYLGIAMMPRSGWLVLTFVLVFWLYYERIMYAEEEFLRERFGEVYERWANATPAFLPRLHCLATCWRRPALPFSRRSVLKREYSGVFAMVACFAVLDAIGETRVRGELTVDPFWAALFSVTLLLYVTLIALKRRTRLLKVPGR